MSYRLLRLSLVLLALGPAALVWAGPATVPKPKLADHVRELLDDYLQGQERVRFFNAAGVDGEISKEEWDAAAGKPNPFARSYDRWVSAIVFDADKNGKLNWVEAEEYRSAVQQRVLALFDKDKDGKLTGPEREVANAYLSLGMRRPMVAGSATQPAGPENPEAVAAAVAYAKPGQWLETWQAIRARHDADGDGKLSEQEYHEAYEELRLFQEQQMIQQFDANKDGVIDENERKAVVEDHRKQLEQFQRESELAKWDANGDGKLDRGELAAKEKARQEILKNWESRRQAWIKELDRDGDGKLSQEELDAPLADQQARKRAQDREMDTNGDGVVSPEEFETYRVKMFARIAREREERERAAATQRATGVIQERHVEP